MSLSFKTSGMGVRTLGTMVGRTTTESFDGRAAATRSFLGWGLIAGPFYLVVAVIHALVKPGFDFSRHSLSLLMLTDTGWIQRLNLIMTGVMVIAAAIGFSRVIEGRTRRAVAILVGIYGGALIASGIAAPDPMAGFPPGADETVTISGLLHLVFGGLGFLALGVAAFVFSAWCRRSGSRTGSALSIIAGVVIIAAFIGGGALARIPAGVLLLWISVVAGLAWLLGASLFLYRQVPHPVIAQRSRS
jgi:hypothetical membrane protein